MAFARNIALAQRFWIVLRADGWRQALTLTYRYLLQRWQRPRAALLPKDAAPGSHYLSGTWQYLAREEAFHASAAPALMRQRRQIAVIGDLNLPQCRKYRVEQWAAFWHARGVGVAYAHYEDVPRAVRLLQDATHVMEYRLRSGAQTDILRYEARRLRLPILYDLDDPLFSVSAYETYGNMQMLPDWQKRHFLAAAPGYLNMMNGADVLTMSTPGLVAHARLYSNRPVYLRRNFADAETLETGRAAMRARDRSDGLWRVAFASGSMGHEADLADILEPLEAFVRGDARRRLLLMGHFDGGILSERLREQVEREDFADYPCYLQALARADCAIMPLADDVFNRCKSAVRVIDAAAVGVPSIVSGVGDLPWAVEDGVTGFVARTPGDWIRALNDLAGDVAGGREMGAAARARLELARGGERDPEIVAPEILDWVSAG